MQTTTVQITRQEFDTILTALHIFKDNGNLETEKSNMIAWYQQNEGFDLLDDSAITTLIKKLCTTRYAPACALCGWDATCAFNSTQNSYCDECKEFKKLWPAKFGPTPDKEMLQHTNKSGTAAEKTAPAHADILTTGEKAMKLDSTIESKEQIDLCLMAAAITLAPIEKNQIAKIEVYGTDLEDPGADYCEYRFYDRENKLLGSRREMGY